MPRARVTDEDVGRTLREFLNQTVRTVQTTTGGTSSVGEPPTPPQPNPMTAAGQMIRGATGGSQVAVAAPTVAGYVLTADADLLPVWAAPTGGGGTGGGARYLYWMDPADAQPTWLAYEGTVLEYE